MSHGNLERQGIGVEGERTDKVQQREREGVGTAEKNLLKQEGEA